MKDRDWCKEMEAEINSLKDRVTKLEGGRNNSSCSDPNVFELDIEWPEADIAGLHFNYQKTHGVFERKEDGNYYSRDILFISARDTDDGTGRDLLSEYLSSDAVRKAFMDAINISRPQASNVGVFLPVKNQGVKKYNGVRWMYWLKPRSGGTNYFCIVAAAGSATNGISSNAYGCAPAFCVAEQHG